MQSEKKKQPEELLKEILSGKVEKEEIASLQEMKKISEDANWLELKKKIRSDDAVSSGKRFLFPTRLAAAILIVLLTGSSIMLFRFRNISQIEEINSLKESAELSLSDGSVILLNSGSAIQYQQKGFRRSREVKMKGEAFFEVEKASQNPFLIYLANTTVKVVGTSFNIDARDQDKVYVCVLSGEVLFYDSADPDNAVTLKAGQQAHFNEMSRDFMVDSLRSENFLFWKTGLLNFRNAKLSQVFSELSQCFNTIIIVQDEAIRDLTLTTSFKNQDLDDILDELTLLFDLSYFKQNDTIYIEMLNK